jgi:hypothetical protein
MLDCTFRFAQPPQFVIEPESADDPWYRFMAWNLVSAILAGVCLRRWKPLALFGTLAFPGRPHNVKMSSQFSKYRPRSPTTGIMA